MKTYIHIQVRNHEVVDAEKLRKWFDRLLKNLAKGEDSDHEFWEQETNKTKAQNNYYWSQVQNSAEELGMDANELHETLKEELLPEEQYIVLIRKKNIETTRGLRKDWMSDYIERCARFLAEHCGVVWGDSEEYKHQFNN